MPQAVVYDLIVIGGGASGFFAGISLLEKQPRARVLLLEKSGKLLSKVKISGGGRCNVTHHCFDSGMLLTSYPRGNPWLSEVFHRFSVQDTLKWFRQQGVEIVAEADGRMFPKSNDSQSVVEALLMAYERKGGEILLNQKVAGFIRKDGVFEVQTGSGEVYCACHLLIAVGGSPDLRGFEFLKATGHRIVTPVPSLFTFNTIPHPWALLQGLSVSHAKVSLCEGPFSFSGPVLVTHWGFSGPAVLKLSAFAARFLAEKKYQYQFSIDFLPHFSADQVFELLLEFQVKNGKKKPLQSVIFDLPRRLWEQFCKEADLDEHFNWAEVGRKKIKVLAELLKNRIFSASGKTTYKEEFVTSGGIALDEVKPATCESLKCPSLFFAGEILDVDGITGGFNFQAAWSTAFVAASEISRRMAKNLA